MRAVPLLLIVLLSLGVIAHATAAETAAADNMSSNEGSSHASDRAAGRETSSSSGDAMNIPRSGARRSVPSNSSRTNSSSSSADDTPTHFGDSDTSPDGSSRGSSGLGWQSLLPGSIQ
jgi:hypothetical protein